MLVIADYLFQWERTVQSDDESAEEIRQRLVNYIDFLPDTEKQSINWERLFILKPGTDRWRRYSREIVDRLYEIAEVKGEFHKSVLTRTDGIKAERIVQPIVVILERIRSPFNAGSIIRCAEAAGCRDVVLTGYTPGPDHKNVMRAAMGAQELIGVAREDDPNQAVERLRNEGFHIVGLEVTDRSVPYHDFTFPCPVALVVGNEELGISIHVLDRCDTLVHIPLLGAKNSLNVAQALAVVLFEIVRQFTSQRG